MESADVIFANIQGLDVIEALKIFSLKKKKSKLILLAGQQEMKILLEEDMHFVDDIWTLPMTEKEFLFRVMRWKKRYEQEKDCWEVNHFLDTTINSVPDLIWFKDKEGAHLKVNDSFC